MAEREVLVESFDELRVGMLLRFTGCHACSHSHRFMLVRAHRDVLVSGLNTEVRRVPLAFEALPSCHPPYATGVVSEHVQLKQLYRIIDGLESSETTTTKRERSVTA